MSVFSESCFQPIIDVVKLACTKNSAEGHRQDITQNDDSSESSSSSSDSESDIDFKKYHTRIGDSFEDDIQQNIIAINDLRYKCVTYSDNDLVKSKSVGKK